MGCVAIVLAAPARPQETVPAVKAELVQLDAVVTDAQGRPVSDLTREAFEVLEDGKPQRLTHFLFVSSATPAAAPVPPGTPPAAAAGPEAPRPGRQIVIVVDDLHIAPGNLEFTQTALLRFVDEFTAPDDRIALVTTSSLGGIGQLSLDRAALKTAIGQLAYREATVVPARGSQITPAQAELILKGDLSALQLGARSLIAEPGSLFEGTSPRAALSEAGAGPAAAGASIAATAQERAAEQEAQRQARGILSEALRFSVVTLSALDDVVRSLASLPGRKLCLLVSDGFLYGAGTSEERTRELRRVIDAATRSGAVVYSLDPRGLATGGTDASVAGAAAPAGLRERVERQSVQLHHETLMALANDTGGFLVRGGNDLADGLRRMLDDNRAYYLMAYEPTNRKRDGKFRRIELRLTSHPGYTVRTRRGYFAPDDKEPKRAAAAPAPAVVAPALDAAAARALLAAPLPAEGVPVRLAADFLSLPAQGSRVIVQAHIDLARLDWEQAQDRHRAGLELVGGVYDASGRPVGEPFGRRADFDLSTAEHRRAVTEGLSYQHQLALAPGRYEVRLVARDSRQARVGGHAQALEVPDLGTGKLAISGVFLSSSASAIGAGADAVRDAQARRSFRRSDNLFFQLYVYNARVDEQGSHDVVLQAQVLSGTRLVAASKPQPAALAKKDGVPLPESNGIGLEGLEPGPYQLRVVVVDRKAGITLNGRVDFTLE
jgi:VWFA-related protein